MGEQSMADNVPESDRGTSKSSVFNSWKRKRNNAAASNSGTVEDTPSLSKEACTPDDQRPVNANDTSTDAEQEYVSGLRLFAVLGSLVLASFLTSLDTSIVSTAIPHITTEFHSLSDVGWYGSAYLLASCSLQPLTGKVYNRFGTKIVFLSFFALFELGSLLCGVAHSSNMFIVGRAVAGMGTSGLTNGALTIISACVPLVKRPVYLGLMLSIAQFGILLGPVIGGVLTEYVTWRWCFYINLPSGGAVTFLLLFIHVPDLSNASEVKPGLKDTLSGFDLLGFAFFAPATIQFLLALEWGGTTYAWGSATIIGLFCGSAGTLCVFIAWEHHRGESAMIPLALVKQRIMWSSCLTVFLLFGGMIMYSYYLPIYFQAVRGTTPTMSGVDLLPGIISQMISAIVSGVLVGRLGYYLPWILSGSALASICMGLLSTFTPDTSKAKWIGYQIIGGVGRGCSMQIPIVAVQNLVPKEQTAVSCAFLIFCRTFGGALFLSFAETTFSAGLKNALAEYAPGVSYTTVATAGATGFRSAIPKALVPNVIIAYTRAISHVFYFAAAACAFAFLLSWGLGWKSIKKVKTVEPSA